MKENGTRSFKPVGSQVRFDRSRRRKKRTAIIWAIAAVSLAITQLDISEKSGKIWGIILIGIIPAAILGYGFYNRYRRARR